ncbi:MAG: hypothetical protein KatS3mg114_0872 [Planctomycetaceae bacterium]|nr:MAG: hypothetical protein KatS3mg114_0872 [Planctomycetaceae bacterium]
MLLVPDDRLREVQPVLLEERRVVRTVRVPAPDVEPATGDQHAGDVAEPGIQQPVELVVRHEVLASGRSLARSFFCVGFDFSGCRATSIDW